MQNAVSCSWREAWGSTGQQGAQPSIFSLAHLRLSKGATGKESKRAFPDRILEGQHSFQDP